MLKSISAVGLVLISSGTISLSAQAASLGNIFGALAGRSGEMGHEKSVDNALVKVAAQINRQTPMAVDKSTRLDKVSTEPGQKLTYHYTLPGTTGSDIKSADFQKLISPSLTTRVCGSPEMQKFLRSGVTIAYLYRDKDGKPIGGAKVAPLDCSSRS
ncbi:MAG: hypothetical protein JWQ23_3773 [Herminiimonas sp.]|nr:hypothetical protein [Herminiimonas sp.]